MGANVGRSVGEVGSIEGVCRSCPERVVKLFQCLDLGRRELGAVKAAVDGKDWPAACRALLAYYREGKTAGWLRRPVAKPGTATDPTAEAILNDTITCYRLTAKVPRRPGGGLDWAYNGPNGDREWGWGLNRHSHLSALLSAYRKTGNLAYVRCIDRHVRDWVTSNPYPAKRSSTPQWRGLETFFRVVRWAEVFFELQEVDALSPAARVLILSSIPDHADYLRRFHAGGGNWITMEMYGLATAAVVWPEFKDAGSWLDYTWKRMLPEMNRQVYPDGAQKELTSSYHHVTLRSFERFADVLAHSGRDTPSAFKQGLERMYNYMACTIRPDGHGPLNNDSDLSDNRSRVVSAAKAYKRSDWTYIATHGKQGTRPEGLPSVVFPYAGQVIMRSGWDADAHWAFFDVGPLGIGHWHHDKLHLSVAAFGRDLLVDSGRYTYKGGAFRGHFVGSASHNVILIDGKGQKTGARAVSKAMSGNYAVTPGFDFARGTFDEGFRNLDGSATHTRAVLYVRGKYVVVVDRIATDRPRTVQPLWHFHPDCAVVVAGSTVATTDAGKGNLRIAPVSDLTWGVELIKGRTKPSIQGWYSRCYNLKCPSPTAVYTTKITGPATFAWVLVPAKGTVPTARAEMTDADADVVGLQVEFPGAKPDRLGVPMTGTVSANGDGVVIETPSQ